jgi:hypothetical protein
MDRALEKNSKIKHANKMFEKGLQESYFFIERGFRSELSNVNAEPDFRMGSFEM